MIKNLKDLTEEKDITSEYGSKAEGLRKIMPYSVKTLIVSSHLHLLWRCKKTEYQEALLILSKKLLDFFGSKDELLIRSSAINETLTVRGQFLSLKLSKIKDLSQVLNLIFKDCQNFSEEIKMGLIFQKKISYKIKGHLSNERRISNKKNEWLIETEQDRRLSNINHRAKKVKAKKPKDQVTSLKCTNFKEVSSMLKQFGGQFVSDDYRCHFEWLWDGNEIIIVQMDIEERIGIENSPGSNWEYKKQNAIGQNRYKLLSNKVLHKSSKFESQSIFKNCDLPVVNIYWLNDETVFNSILEDKTPKALEDDLVKLLVQPIVIRIDILDDSNFLLPRTNTIFNVEGALAFIKSSLELLKKSSSLSKVCFLFHNYIASRKCALSFSRPNSDKVKIDSSWGLPDGLHCNPCDSYVYDTTGVSSLSKSINCKTNYLDCSENGDWVTIQSGWDYDWKESLTKDELKTIAEYSKKICSEINKPVGVMFFIEASTEFGLVSVLPWYFTLDIPDFNASPSEVMYPKNEVVVRDRKTFDFLKSKANFKEVKVRLSLSPDYIRDRNFIDQLGVFFVDKEISVNLEGSVLSHVYYILKHVGVKLKCVVAFNPKFRNVEYNKFVRDLIPEKIEGRGESILYTLLHEDEFIPMLKLKLLEEVLELSRESDSYNVLQEAADVYEVLKAILDRINVSISDLQKLARKKKKKVGGFDKGVYLLGTKDSGVLRAKGEQQYRVISHDSKVKSEKLSMKTSNEGFVLNIPIIPSLLGNLSKRISTGDDDYRVTIKYYKSSLKVEIKKGASTNPNQLQFWDKTV